MAARGQRWGVRGIICLQVETDAYVQNAQRSPASSSCTRASQVKIAVKIRPCESLRLQHSANLTVKLALTRTSGAALSLSQALSGDKITGTFMLTYASADLKVGVPHRVGGGRDVGVGGTDGRDGMKGWHDGCSWRCCFKIRRDSDGEHRRVSETGPYCHSAVTARAKE